VDYVRLDTPQSVYTALNKLWAHQPVLLRGTPLAMGLVGKWSFRQLVRLLAVAQLEHYLSSHKRAKQRTNACPAITPPTATHAPAFLACRHQP
jgi:hypothetical protein